MKTTAISLPRLTLPSLSGLTARLGDFVTLMKPRVMLLAVFTALVGFMIAPGHLDPLLGQLQFSQSPRGLVPPVFSTCGTTPTSTP
jgi:protoheme IX farnesyltransferase